MSIFGICITGKNHNMSANVSGYEIVLRHLDLGLSEAKTIK